jgi:hypothetical protein
MQLNFRQGLVRRQTDISSTPTFLQKTSVAGDYIDLNVSPDPTIFTIAHGNANYLVEESKSLTKAWGPLVATGQTQWLYWDIDWATGALTRGFTILPPLHGAEPPLSPAVDQHWFDLTDRVMKVWNGAKWLMKLRAFAVQYNSSAILVHYTLGSQVGLDNTPCTAGHIIFGNNNKPLRQADGTFVTTESELIVGRGSSTNVKFDSVLIYAMATENMPRYSLISFTAPDKISLASHLNVNREVGGIIIEDLYESEVGLVITNGSLKNEFWSWPANAIGKPLFCGPSGQLTLTPPPVGITQQVGLVRDSDSVYINIMVPVIL